MAETSGFFDAEELVDGTFDREYIAEQWANYFKLFIGNGVFINPTNQLKVVAGEGMQIIIKHGWAFINGYWYHNDSDLVIAVPVNSTPSTVNSGVFVQFDSQNRTVTTILANGRTEVDRELPHYELKLAEVSVATGTTAITDSMITDTRIDENVCGFVKGLVSVVSTDDLFQQFTDMFMTWFDEMKDQLSEDAAGHLQQEIDTIQSSVDEINDRLDNLDMSAVSDAYNSALTYEVDEYCIYNNTLYECITAVTVPEVFDSTKWRATNVGAELKRINSNLSVRYDEATHYIQIQDNGTWYNYRYFNPNRIEPAFKLVTTGAPSLAYATLHTGYIDPVNLTFVSESSVSINSGTQYSNNYFTIGYNKSAQYSGWDFKLKKIPVKSGTTISGMTTKNATNTWYNMGISINAGSEYYWDCSEAE